MISNNYNISPSFGSLRVRYDAQDAMENLPRAVLKKIYCFGRYLEDTKHVDLELSANLTPYIRAKGVRQGGIRPPFIFVEPKGGSRNLTIKSGFRGEIPYGEKTGDLASMDVRFRTSDLAYDIFQRLNSANGDIEKAGILTKVIDDEMEFPAKKARDKFLDSICKIDLIDNIMSEFGVFAK